MPLALFFLWAALTVLGLLCFCVNFKIVFYSSVKNAIGIFVEVTLNLYTAFGNTFILHNINSASPWAWKFFSIFLDLFPLFYVLMFSLKSTLVLRLDFRYSNNFEAKCEYDLSLISFFSLLLVYKKIYWFYVDYVYCHFAETDYHI